MDIAYVANTNAIECYGLQDNFDQSYIDTATVSVTIKSEDGQTVITGPISMTYVAASNGNYRGILPAATSLVNGIRYLACISVSDTAQSYERIGYWEYKFMAETRV